MCDRTAPPGQATRSGPELDLLADSVHAVARNAVDLLGQVRVLQAQAHALSRSTLSAAAAIEQARMGRDD